MREYGFVETATGIYRVFGRQHPHGSVLLLLRYYRCADGRWLKPPVFSAETPAGRILRHYDLGDMTATTTGITVGVGPARAARYQRYSDPLRPPPHEFEDLPILRYANVGITGSRLVGLQRAVSDLDLVLYGRDGPALGAELLAEHAAKADLWKLSRTIRRIVALTRGHVPRLDVRNIFKGCLAGHRPPVKLDLVYAETAGHVRAGFVRSLAPASGSTRTVFDLIVEDAGQRHFFPGFLQCRTAHGHAVKLHIRDHVLSFLLPGDRLAIRGRFIANERSQQIIGDHVLALDLR